MICCGYLEKACPLDSMASTIAAAAGKPLRTTTRYFVLRASSPYLEYYVSDAPKSPKKGQIDLMKCSGITMDAQIPGKATKANTFSIEINDRIVYLSTNSRDMMTRWIESITSHLANLERANNQGLKFPLSIMVRPMQWSILNNCNGLSSTIAHTFRLHDSCTDP
jgi:hypothetical protein